MEKFNVDALFLNRLNAFKPKEHSPEYRSLSAQHTLLFQSLMSSLSEKQQKLLLELDGVNGEICFLESSLIYKQGFLDATNLQNSKDAI